MIKLSKMNPVVMALITLLTVACGKGTTEETNDEKGNNNNSTNQVAQYPIVATGQINCFNNSSLIAPPSKGAAFYGQDAQYIQNTASYTDNNDGTITDNITGLIWQKEYSVMTYEEALEAVKTFELAGQSDWRLPNIKELYSLINFSGADPSGAMPPQFGMNSTPAGAIPFIDTSYFSFKYGSNGKRIIDTQLLSSTRYKGKTMGRDEAVFGLNVADGRIKGYPLVDPMMQTGKSYTVRFVRGNTEYGKNNFEEKDGMITDKATNLVWTKEDSQAGMNWEAALAYAAQKNTENYLGHADWRLPNAKELQSIVDYTRSPKESNSAAINPIFNVSTITDEGGKSNYPFYWTSTTHKNASNKEAAVYICFGEALGFFAPPHAQSNKELVDVHGAGAQRSDPKIGDPNDYPEGHGPQGDVIRINNYVRLVRDL